MNKWFDPKITMGNVVTVALVLGSLAWGYGSLTGKVDTLAKLSDTLPQLTERVAKVEATIAVMLQFGGGSEPKK
jgi:hypothetical protein